jgi:hypothetical protein
VIFARRLQGAMGWYMVKSGLVDDPRVSQFRLAAHLLLAFAIFAAMFWTALSLLDRCLPDGPSERALHRSRRRRRRRGAMVATGAFVAGIRAGFAYNTFPLMNGALVPPEVLMLTPWWRNLFWNMATVQLAHRAVALLVAVLVLVLWTRVTAAPGLPARARVGAHLLVAALAVQVALGIATLLLVVPLPRPPGRRRRVLRRSRRTRSAEDRRGAAGDPHQCRQARPGATGLPRLCRRRLPPPCPKPFSTYATAAAEPLEGADALGALPPGDHLRS